jgi:hypothetical protein
MSSTAPWPRIHDSVVNAHLASSINRSSSLQFFACSALVSAWRLRTAVELSQLHRGVMAEIHLTTQQRKESSCD